MQSNNLNMRRSRWYAVTAFLYYYHTPLAPHNLPNPHYPLLCTTTLASLVKGEVLSPEKIRATTGGIAPYPHQPFQNRTISLSFRRGGARSSCCTKYCHSHNHCKRTTTPRSSPTLPKPHYPLPRTMSLPPLSKVRCCRPKKFGRLPEGLLPIRTNPSKTALSLALHHHTCLPC